MANFQGASEELGWDVIASLILMLTAEKQIPINKPPFAGWKYTWCVIPRVDQHKRSVAERIGDFHEVYRLLDPDLAQAQAQRCVQCGFPFCTTGCPLGNRIPEWMQLAAEGRFLEAAAVSGGTSNMPEICSRVCPQEQLCEGMCTLNERTDAVAIGAIEKFIQEYAFAHGGVEAHRVLSNGFRVAVVGSGPAGLACADELIQRGYEVTVFESQPVLGGLLVNGIPAFKLEKWVVERRINILRQRGVVFHTQAHVGRDLTLNELRRDYDAIFLGMGAQKSKEPDLPGADLRGVYQPLPFLIEKNVGPAAKLDALPVRGKRLVVLGGGDTAMDCLRTAIRAQCLEAICLYRRDLDNMPGNRLEYQNAIAEGAQFSFLTNPVAIEGDEEGHVQQVRCERMQLGEPDAKGRRKPIRVLGSEFVVPADVVLIAFGFDPIPFDPDSEWGGIAVNDWDGVIVDENQMTTLPGVFSGGDQVLGANLVVYAVRDGRKAAAGIQRYLDQKR